MMVKIETPTDQSRPNCRRLAIALLRDDHGQDLVEYALLVSFIGITSVVAWAAIETAIGTAYVSWNGAVYGLWETPAPSGS